MQNVDSIKLGVVDSQHLLREALGALLNGIEGIDVILSVGAAPDILPALEKAPVDVMLFHVDAAAPASVALLQELPRVVEHTRAIVLACSTSMAEYAKTVELGAMGVVSCDEAGAVLLKAIRKVHAGELWLDRAQTAGVITRLARGYTHRDPDTIKIESLTARQREIVSLVAEGLTNKQLAERLFITEATARNHMTAILDKLELSDRFQLAVYAFRHGLAGYAHPVVRISSAR